MLSGSGSVFYFKTNRVKQQIILTILWVDAVFNTIFAFSLECNRDLTQFTLGIPRWCSGKESACLAGDTGDAGWLKKIFWRRKWQSTLVFLHGKSHGQRSLAGYSLWDHKESDTVE